MEQRYPLGNLTNSQFSHRLAPGKTSLPEPQSSNTTTPSSAVERYTNDVSWRHPMLQGLLAKPDLQQNGGPSVPEKSTKPLTTSKTSDIMRRELPTTSVDNHSDRAGGFALSSTPVHASYPQYSIVNRIAPPSTLAAAAPGGPSSAYIGATSIAQPSDQHSAANVSGLSEGHSVLGSRNVQAFLDSYRTRPPIAEPPSAPDSYRTRPPIAEPPSAPGSVPSTPAVSRPPSPRGNPPVPLRLRSPGPNNKLIEEKIAEHTAQLQPSVWSMPSHGTRRGAVGAAPVVALERESSVASATPHGVVEEWVDDAGTAAYNVNDKEPVCSVSVDEDLSADPLASSGRRNSRNTVESAAKRRIKTRRRAKQSAAATALSSTTTTESSRQSTTGVRSAPSMPTMSLEKEDEAPHFSDPAASGSASASSVRSADVNANAPKTSIVSQSRPTSAPAGVPAAAVVSSYNRTVSRLRAARGTFGPSSERSSERRDSPSPAPPKRSSWGSSNRPSPRPAPAIPAYRTAMSAASGRSTTSSSAGGIPTPKGSVFDRLTSPDRPRSASLLRKSASREPEARSPQQRGPPPAAVCVNLNVGGNEARIVVHLGDDTDALARNYCREHRLGKETYQRLANILARVASAIGDEAAQAHVRGRSPNVASVAKVTPAVVRRSAQQRKVPHTPRLPSVSSVQAPLLLARVSPIRGPRTGFPLDKYSATTSSSRGSASVRAESNRDASVNYVSPSSKAPVPERIHRIPRVSSPSLPPHEPAPENVTVAQRPAWRSSTAMDLPSRRSSIAPRNESAASSVRSQSRTSQSQSRASVKRASAPRLPPSPPSVVSEMLSSASPQGTVVGSPRPNTPSFYPPRVASDPEVSAITDGHTSINLGASDDTDISIPTIPSTPAGAARSRSSPVLRRSTPNRIQLPVSSTPPSVSLDPGAAARNRRSSGAVSPVAHSCKSPSSVPKKHQVRRKITASPSDKTNDDSVFLHSPTPSGKGNWHLVNSEPLVCADVAKKTALETLASPSNQTDIGGAVRVFNEKVAGRTVQPADISDIGTVHVDGYSNEMVQRSSSGRPRSNDAAAARVTAQYVLSPSRLRPHAWTKSYTPSADLGTAQPLHLGKCHDNDLNESTDSVVLETPPSLAKMSAEGGHRTLNRFGDYKQLASTPQYAEPSFFAGASRPVSAPAPVSPRVSAFGPSSRYMGSYFPQQQCSHPTYPPLAPYDPAGIPAMHAYGNNDTDSSIGNDSKRSHSSKSHRRHSHSHSHSHRHHKHSKKSRSRRRSSYESDEEEIPATPTASLGYTPYPHHPLGFAAPAPVPYGPPLWGYPVHGAQPYKPPSVSRRVRFDDTSSSGSASNSSASRAAF